MAGATLIESQVERDADGFLVDPHAWTEEIAAELAHENGITTLSDQHWHVIHLMRDAYLTDG